MFYPSTTIWQNQTHSNPLNPRGNRPVFGVVGDKIRNFFAGGTNFKNEVFDAADALSDPIISRLKWIRWFMPTQYAWSGIKGAYNYVAKPIYKISSVVAGTAWEAGCGVKDAIYYPVKTIAKAPLVNLKMTFLDFTTYLMKGAIDFPVELTKTPIRFFKEAKKVFLELPEKVANVVKTTRDNLAKTLESMVKPSSFIIPSPIEVAKSIAKTTRDLVNGTLVESVKNSIRLGWNPVAPALAVPAGAADILLKSKWQYATSMWKAGGQAIEGGKRIMNAPGKEFDTSGVKNWLGKVFPKEEKPETAKDAKPGEGEGNGDKPEKPGKGKGDKGKKGKPKKDEEGGGEE